ncbi:hypothetical protein Tco_1375399 [Tanacetum coccineum]
MASVFTLNVMASRVSCSCKIEKPKMKAKKGLWSLNEDQKLRDYVTWLLEYGPNHSRLRALGIVTPWGPALTPWPSLRYRGCEIDDGVGGQVDTPTPR